MKDIQETLSFLAGKFARPLLVTGVWFACLITTRGFDVGVLAPVSTQYPNLVERLQAWLGATFGLELAPWHFIAVAGLVFVAVFDGIVAAVWAFFPWRLSWSTAQFWRASKTWKEPLRLSAVLELSGDLLLGEIESHMKRLLSTIKADHPELYEQRFASLEHRFQQYARYYSAVAAVLVVTVAMIPLEGLMQLSALSLAGLVATVAIVLALLLLLRVLCEVACEKIEWETPYFVLSLEDRSLGQTANLVSGYPEATASILRELRHPGLPGFPYGRFWLLHFLRQVPGLSGLGSFEWRPEEALRSELPDLYRAYDEEVSGRIRGEIATTPLARLVAHLLDRLVRLGLVKNGGALVGATIDFKTALAKKGG